MKYILIILIALSILSCDKEPQLVENCGSEIELVSISDNVPPTNYIVVYYAYSSLVKNQAFKYGIGDSMMITTASSIMLKSNIEHYSIEDLIRNELCLGYDYYYNYPETFESLIQGSQRIEVYHSNKRGQIIGERTNYTNMMGQNISGTQPNMVFKFIK